MHRHFPITLFLPFLFFLLPTLILCNYNVPTDPLDQQPFPLLPTSLLWHTLSQPLNVSFPCNYFSNNGTDCRQLFQNNFLKCPGAFCARKQQQITDLNLYSPQNYVNNLINPTTNSYATELYDFGSCSSCPYGYRSDGYVCIPCRDSMNLFSIFYIICMFLLAVFGNCYGVERNVSDWKFRIALELSAIVESMFASILSVICLNVTFQIFWTCQPRGLEDWYPIFYDPPGFSCSSSYDSVYPLYTIIMVYLAIGIPLLLLFRVPLFIITSFIGKLSSENRSKYSASLFFGLWFQLFFLAFHFICAGLFYYSWPYLVVVGCFLWDLNHLYRIFKGFDKDFIVRRILLFLIRSVFCAWATFSIFIYFFPFANAWYFLFVAILVPLYQPVLAVVVWFVVKKLLDRTDDLDD